MKHKKTLDEQLKIAKEKKTIVVVTESDKKGVEKGRLSVMSAFGQLTQLGLTMACCVVIGVLIGRFLDSRLGTSPWLLLVFAVLGGAASFKVLFDITKEWKD